MLPGGLTGIGTLMLLVGGVWFFQGINILPGSFMTGSTFWAAIGATVVVLGAGLILFARRRGRGNTPPG